MIIISQSCAGITIIKDNNDLRQIILLLASLIGQYCFARRRAAAAGRVDGQAADTARQASTVTSRQGDILF